jgi:hypothetical protein
VVVEQVQDLHDTVMVVWVAVEQVQANQIILKMLLQEL